MPRRLTTRGCRHIVEASETLHHFSGSYGQASPLTKSVHLEIVPLNPRLPGEVDMFARSVSANLKPGTLTEFTKTMENEIVPWLRKQKGFQDAITLAVPGGREVVAISFWDQKENAQAYNSMGYPEVLKILGKLLDGTPHVRTFDVVSSTLQQIVPRVTA